jgi:5-oxoprolinase (ATP-hydrolysing)
MGSEGWGDGEERTISLGGKNSAKMGRGDRVVICTPGGGGWGAKRESKAGNGKKGVKEASAWLNGV